MRVSYHSSAAPRRAPTTKDIVWSSFHPVAALALSTLWTHCIGRKVSFSLFPNHTGNLESSFLTCCAAIAAAAASAML